MLSRSSPVAPVFCLVWISNKTRLLTLSTFTCNWLSRLLSCLGSLLIRPLPRKRYRHGHRLRSLLPEDRHLTCPKTVQTGTYEREHTRRDMQNYWWLVCRWQQTVGFGAYRQSWLSILGGRRHRLWNNIFTSQNKDWSHKACQIFSKMHLLARKGSLSASGDQNCVVLHGEQQFSSWSPMCHVKQSTTHLHSVPLSTLLPSVVVWVRTVSQSHGYLNSWWPGLR